MSMIFSNVGGDLKNYRLQVIDSWVDGESPKLMDNPQDGDMISCRSLVDGVPTVTATKVYSDGEWVDVGGGGGGGETTIDLTLFSETGTYANGFVEFLSPYDFFDYSPVTVIYDGNSYTCETQTASVFGQTIIYYGATPTESGDAIAFDWSVYPFFFASFNGAGMYTQSEPADKHLVIRVAKSFSSYEAEKTVLDSGTLVEDDGNYVADITASVDTDCYVELGGNTYPVGSNAFGGFFFTVGEIFNGKIYATVGGDFAIVKYVYENGVTFKPVAVNNNTISPGVTYAVDGSVSVVDGVATKSALNSGGTVNICEGDIIRITAAKSGTYTGVKWSGTISGTNCTVTQLYQTDSAVTIYRYVKVTNIQSEARITSVAQTYSL